MNISPITNFYAKKPNFTSTRRTEYYLNPNNKNGDTFVSEVYAPNNFPVKNSNVSVFFREDIEDDIMCNWKDFARKLHSVLPKDEKINIYDFASSDGSEAYSLIISLMEALGEKEAERFLPIKAFDIDAGIVKRAKSNFIYASCEDIDKINNYTDGNLDKYFYLAKEKKGDCLLLVRPILSSNVVFQQARIQDEAKNLNKPNSMIFARNMWKYLPIADRVSTFQELYNTMDKSSRIFLGDFDFRRGGLIPKVDSITGSLTGELTCSILPPEGLTVAGFKKSDFPGQSYEKR